ncbi:nuclear transport factor 2 family protein [Kineosporia sp. NBRC 101731]|uniref:nuclear transport factor 2 family protein n=1 Tax=Kineosporia sp. NBRC 101731 TaxID=3032199 RepID=UPI0024A30A05|nr:nuclear transport factor 2 family protein [Kineosporia sp. NBRC 101731]GLY29014.1 hypothetical protein Kisp02_23790 [Kineosporia sp. NBRC 101731]
MDAVSTYLDAIDAGNKQSVIDIFTADAVVTDDGTTYRGHEEILGWLGGAASEWTTTSTRLGIDRQARTVVALLRVEGNFPGGRVDLRSEFALADDGRITALTIRAVDASDPFDAHR